LLTSYYIVHNDQILIKGLCII